MIIERSDRGFEFLRHDTYLQEDAKHSRLASQSSAIGPYEDSMDRPGSSYLWIGEHHHLNRKEVAQFVTHLQAWLESGSLEAQANGK
jgi:hypothetical protein